MHQSSLLLIIWIQKNYQLSILWSVAKSENICHMIYNRNSKAIAKQNLYLHIKILLKKTFFKVLTHFLKCAMLQVIKARFGKGTHLVFCTFAFLTNLIVMMSLTIAGTAVLNRWLWNSISWKLLRLFLTVLKVLIMSISNIENISAWWLTWALNLLQCCWLLSLEATLWSGDWGQPSMSHTSTQLSFLSSSWCWSLR